VVVFPSNLRHVGDVRQLQGKVVEIHGPVKLYDGRGDCPGTRWATDRG
jgi:hypothetical protein